MVERFKSLLIHNRRDRALRNTVKSDGDRELSEISLEPVQDRESQTPPMGFNPRTPMLTYLLLGLNAVIWLLTEFYNRRYGGDANILFGAKVNDLIMAGEYWRLLTPVFFHGGIVHLLVNSYSLYALGPSVERLFGHAKFLVIYLTAGIMGNIASFIFSTNPSVGASGAIFGLLGAMIYMGQKKRILFGGSFGTGIAVTLIYNLWFGFTQAGIDNSAHIGGLIGGYLLAFSVGLAGDRRFGMGKFVMLLLSATLALGGMYIGASTSGNILLKANQRFEQQDYLGSEKLAKEVLQSGKRNADATWKAQYLLSASLINQKKNEEALDYARALAETKPEVGHYLTGLCYYNLQQPDLAMEELQKAVQLDPENEHARELLDSLKAAVPGE